MRATGSMTKTAAAVARLHCLGRRGSPAAAALPPRSYSSLLSPVNCDFFSTTSLASLIPRLLPSPPSLLLISSCSLVPLTFSSSFFFSLFPSAASSSSSFSFLVSGPPPSASSLQSCSRSTPAAGLYGAWMPGFRWSKKLHRYKTDVRYKGKRCMSPSAGALPADAMKLSPFEKQKRSLETWLTAARQRVRALPVKELREAAAARVLQTYKQKLEQLYGPVYVQREWNQLFLIAKASLLEAPEKST